MRHINLNLRAWRNKLKSRNVSLKLLKQMKHKVAQLKTEMKINQIKVHQEQRRKNKKQKQYSYSAHTLYCLLKLYRPAYNHLQSWAYWNEVLRGNIVGNWCFLWQPELRSTFYRPTSPSLLGFLTLGLFDMHSIGKRCRYLACMSRTTREVLQWWCMQSIRWCMMIRALNLNYVSVTENTKAAECAHNELIQRETSIQWIGLLSKPCYVMNKKLFQIPIYTAIFSV